MDYELVEEALIELFCREVQIAKELSYQILEQKNGDMYLRACVLVFLYNHDKKNFLEYIRYKINTLNYELGQLMSDLSGDNLQIDGKNIENSFLNEIFVRYNYLDEETKEKIRVGGQ